VTDRAIHIRAGLERFSDHWSPKAIAAMNEYHVKLVKVLGEFVWHRHEETDELFLVIDGTMTIEMEDRDAVTLGELDLFVVPRGVSHRPVSPAGASVLLIEPSDVVNTGDAEVGALTSEVAWLDI
jgi:mannose-6-phosphate isomerase-like protein (cupin superfamily)